MRTVFVVRSWMLVFAALPVVGASACFEAHMPARLDMDGGNDADTDADTDTDTDADTDIDTDTDSDTDADAGVFECTGTGMWLDPETNLCWENPPASAPVLYDAAIAHCASLGAKWHMPTISELRSIVDGCDRMSWDLLVGVCDDMADCCTVSDACNGVSCWDMTMCDGCMPLLGGPGPWGCYIKAGLLGTCTDPFFSSTERSSGVDEVWTVAFNDGYVVQRDTSTTNGRVRCVRELLSVEVGPDPCTPLRAIECGESASGETADAGSSDGIDLYSCAPFELASREVAYGFASPLNAVVDVTIDDLTSDLSLMVLPGSGAGACDPSSCVAGSFTHLLESESVSFTAAPDDPYSIVIDSWGALTGGYHVSVDCTECIPEGGAAVVFPGAPSCCPSLDTIPCDGPDADGGACAPCPGAEICANCGDSNCGPGENECNCPVDCPP
ncbi:MAG: DUF1566 domain-containing protein [Proteobacteria bacterium]|nr:DUF1566 domain-containing protein [Pseudomonadota bacterium]